MPLSQDPSASDTSLPPFSPSLDQRLAAIEAALLTVVDQDAILIREFKRLRASIEALAEEIRLTSGQLPPRSLSGNDVHTEIRRLQADMLQLQQEILAELERGKVERVRMLIRLYEVCAGELVAGMRGLLRGRQQPDARKGD